MPEPTAVPEVKFPDTDSGFDLKKLGMVAGSITANITGAMALFQQVAGPNEPNHLAGLIAATITSIMMMGTNSMGLWRYFVHAEQVHATQLAAAQAAIPASVITDIVVDPKTGLVTSIVRTATRP